ncbi:GCN5-related N-acetyltransferase 6, chloroplastic-like isoform X3 [Cornus florida]|uniref:GCN5-related N-acetyltransferase 6, chloroplastic-like isoform X3 n=1 Tax=Cornus florida TaxID=4283 RepID=UPI0028969ED4|nr:GCN5-related N-acetyltransferase 6, chloroplastic-like isoform X3 [Cornus florida]
MMTMTTRGPLFQPRETFPVSYCRRKTLEVHCDNSQINRHLAVPKSDSSKSPELCFNRLQLTDQECYGLLRRNFGRFAAREAVLDEEYWTAAWLRAEAHWESLLYMRHIDSYKRKYAEQVKKEEKNIRRTVLNSVVGTLDLSIRQFLHGETYPGEVKRPTTVLASQEPFDAHKYAYIANVCVSKFARRQGIASNMLYLATDVATLAGTKELFVHVNAENNPAQELYKKTGFKVVEAVSSPLSKDQRLLMSVEL